MGFGIRAGAVARRALPLYGGTAPPIAPHEDAPFRPAATPQGGFPELDCVRRLLTGDVIAAAEQRATRMGVGADRALIAAGHCSEEAYVRALATTLGVAFEPLDGAPRSLCPLGDDRLLGTPALGLLPLVRHADLKLVVAPRGTAARRLTGMIRNRPELARYFRFTTAERLNRFVLRNAAASITAHASECLGRKRPDLSATNPRSRWSVTLPAVLVLAGIAGPALAPSAITQILALMLSALFLAWLTLRVAAPFAAAPARMPQPELPDNILPVYTIIVALYREAASASRLLSAIARLDYPALGSKCT